MIDLDEVISICKSYYNNVLREKPPHYGETPIEILYTCEMLTAFGWEWGHKVNFPDFTLKKGYHFNKSGLDPHGWYVEWYKGNVGAYQFVSRSDEYKNVQDEYHEFISELLKYNPIYHDNDNNAIIYDVKNGKKLLEDYESIVNRTQRKIDAKIISLEAEKAKERYEELLKKQEQMKKEIDI